MSSSDTNSQSRPAALSLQGVERSYRRGFLLRKQTVLAGVDLELRPGERVGLVGPNGSGKSTLLRLAAGVEPADRGSVRAFGKPLDSFEVRSRIGFAPEGFPFPKDLSAPRALTFGAGLAGLSPEAAQEKSAAWLTRFELDHAGRLALSRYSRGMKQRFALAHALVATPDLLLLDEPSNGLDAPGFVLLKAALDEAHARGATILSCSHLIGDLVAHTDRLLVMVDGRLRDAGRVTDLSKRANVQRVELEGIDENAWPALERAIQEAGGRIVERTPTNQALVELFREA